MSQRFAGRTPERANGGRATLRSTAPKKPRVPRKAKSDAAAPPPAKASAAPAQSAPQPAHLKPQAPTPAAAAAAKSGDDKPKQDNGGAQIVRLDAFRKK